MLVSKAINRLFELALAASIAMLSGCSYDEKQPASGSKPKNQTSARWKVEQEAREFANEPAEVSFGESIFGYDGATVGNDICPSESICIRAPFFGRAQMEGLAGAYPNFFSNRSDGEQFIFSATNMKNLYVVSDVVDLPLSSEVELCAEKNIISASKISGAARLNGSGGRCDRAIGSEINLISPVIKSVQVQSNGRPGEQGDADSLNSKDDDLAALTLEIREKREPVRRCITVGSCATDFESLKAEKELRAKVDENFGWLGKLDLYKVSSLRAWIKKFLASGSLGKFYSDKYPFEYLDTLHCWFEARGTDNTTRLLTEAEVVAGNADGTPVHGRDGLTGGDGGIIQVVTLSSMHSEVITESSGGKGGDGSIPAIQIPGEAKVPDLSEYSAVLENRFRIFCKGKIVFHEVEWRNGKIVYENTMQSSHPGFDSFGTKEYDLLFDLGKSSVFRLGEGYMGPSFHDKLMADHRGLPGSDGRSRQALVIRAADKDEFKHELTAICPVCEMPKIFEEADQI